MTIFRRGLPSLSIYLWTLPLLVKCTISNTVPIREVPITPSFRYTTPDNIIHKPSMETIYTKYDDLFYK